jgi:hypothetical protein
MKARRLLQCLLLATGLAASGAFAHAPSTAYLQIDADAAALTARVALRDIDAVLDLDADGDGTLTWGEVEDRRADIGAWLTAGLALARGGTACTLAAQPPAFARLDGAGYLVQPLRAECPAGGALSLEYRLFAGVDPSHRALVSTPALDAPRLLAPGGRFSLDASAATSFSGFFADGVRHILGGIDHLAFLCALLLPAVLARRDGRWTAVASPGPALRSVFWIVTAFTVAHSITLAAASLGWLRVPGSIIEPLIAATVLAAALNNLYPVVTRRLSALAFCFGLIHGFGFAEVLVPLQLAPADMAWALLAFNLGVEAGQGLVVAAAFALLAAIRHWPAYPRWVLHGGSAALALAACGWLFERVLDVPVFG